MNTTRIHPNRCLRARLQVKKATYFKSFVNRSLANLHDSLRLDQSRMLYIHAEQK